MNNSFKRTFATAVLAVVSWVPLAAHAGLFDDDEARKAILDTRSKLEALRLDIESRLDLKTDKSSMLDVISQNDQLKQEIAKLRGQIEVLMNELSTAQQRQKDFYIDLDNRLRKVEPQKITIDGKEAMLEAGEQKAYDAALILFKAGDYKGASLSFNEFVRRYPDSVYAATAQYWLGNSFYALRDYRNAIDSQRLLLKNYPSSPKASDALLNIASSHVELKEKSLAKKALESILADFAGTPAAQTAKERLAALK